MVKEHNTENYKRLVERLQAACNSITKLVEVLQGLCNFLYHAALYCNIAYSSMRKHVY